jgi:hypothetical protein
VTLYISNFQRPLTERLSKDFFSDPSYASVGCARTTLLDWNCWSLSIHRRQGEEVFEESKSLLFKTLRVQRIYDKDKKTVVYVSFNTRLDKNEDSNKSRFKSSICAIWIELIELNWIELNCIELHRKTGTNKQMAIIETTHNKTKDKGTGIETKMGPPLDWGLRGMDVLNDDGVAPKSVDL